MAFGNPCSINIDPVEKKPLFHFYPASTALSIGTAGCNFNCNYCNTWTISQTSPDRTRNYELMPDKIVDMAIQRNCISIAFTYSEPVTYYEYVYEVSSLARSAGVFNILDSNGYINPEPLKKLCTVVDAANIDLKSFNENTYVRMTGGKLGPVLDTLITLKEEGVWLEITNLIVPDWTDNHSEIREMCKWLYSNGFKDTPLHFSRFQPDNKLNQLSPTPVQNLNMAYEIAKEEGLFHVYIGNVPGTHATSTFCDQCGELVISRAGYTIRIMRIKGGRCEFCNHQVSGRW
jgi:pyruvate formate lyase activating enzyme